jgi:hypothetical protein
MSEVHSIFDAFGGLKQLAEATGLPLQTVCDWRKKGKPEIPPWRRPAVLDAALAKSVPLPAEAVIYLQSSERPKRAAKQC